MGNCQIWYLVAALPWLLFVYASAKYVSYATYFIEKMRRERSADWASMTGGIDDGARRGGPAFLAVVIGTHDKKLDPEFRRLVRMPRRFGLLCLVALATVFWCWRYYLRAAHKSSEGCHMSEMCCLKYKILSRECIRAVTATTQNAKNFIRAPCRDWATPRVGIEPGGATSAVHR